MKCITEKSEDKIKEAARRVFLKKGFDGTTSRDIAREADMNIALTNYYFRSKEKLFEIVMGERIQKLFGILTPVLNDKETTLEEKFERITENYINMLIEHPDLPIFVLSELRNDPERFADRLQAKTHLTQSVFVKQLQAKGTKIHPFHFLMNLLGMIIFPFVGKPVLQTVTGGEENYLALMEQRKKLIPEWLNMMLEKA